MMTRSFLITWPCLLLVCCDKQGSSDDEKREPSSTTKSSDRNITSTQEYAVRPSKPPHEMLAAVNALTPVESEKTLAAIAWDAIELEQQSEAVIKDVGDNFPNPTE